MVKLYKRIVGLIQKITKIRKRYRLVVKIKNIVIKILNLGATGYSIFTIVEPFLKKGEGKSDVVDIQ